MVKSKKEILDEVISNIKNKGRCVLKKSFSGCRYWNNSLGFGCAIGNFLLPIHQHDEFDRTEWVGSLSCILEEHMEYCSEEESKELILNKLRPEYRINDFDFLYNLQSLHDDTNGFFWKKNSEGKLSLTDNGKEFVSSINIED